MASTGAVPRQKQNPSLLLPAPKVRVTGGTAAWVQYEIPDSAWSGGTTTVFMQPVTVAVSDLPSGVGVQLELLRYRRRNAGINGSNGASGKQRGWVHPSNGPAPVNGSWTRGGTHSGCSPAVEALRVTEWAVANTDVVDVSQSMLGFMALRRIGYRTVASTGPVDADVLGISTVGFAKQRHPGRRFAYAGAYHPAPFAFRYSVVDPADLRGSRVSGPVSAPVFIHNEVFPFIVDAAASFAAGFQVASIAPGYDPTRLKAFVGPVTRLP